MIQKIAKITLVILCIIFAPQWTNAKILSPKVLKLPNGLTVYFIEDHRTPIVSLNVGYQVGSADDTYRRSGIAHFLEHMMFKGIPGLAESEFSQRISNLGGETNASTSLDYTLYQITLPKEHAAVAFDLESKRMANLVITDDQVAREKQVILEEISMRYSGNPYFKIRQEALGQMFLRHTYRMPVGGDIGEVQSISREDILDFHHHWYSPSNAIVVVCADLSEREAFQLATTHFGPIPTRGMPERNRRQEPDRPTDLISRMQASDPRIKLPVLTKSMRLSNLSPMDLKRTIALDLITSRLDAPGTGYLWLELVEKAKMAESVNVGISSSFRDHVTAEISIALAPGITIEAMEAKLQQTLEAFLAQAKVELNDQQTERLKKTVISSLSYAHDNIHGTAAALAIHLSTGFLLQLFEDTPETLATIRPSDLQKEAQTWLTKPFPITTLILPSNNADPSLGHLNPPQDSGHVMHHQMEAQ
ncbi:MAG: insulinase family protein [Alphaproteobacteria bacterium]|nr:insulinase family protein [Alphaproteobacteria bacterium]OJV45772.1 MAG: hypothetical protein BGO28_06085 [Alphaproteobacteria bacterium 43-37]